MTDLQDKLLLSTLNRLDTSVGRLFTIVDEHSQALAGATAREKASEATRRADQRRRETILVVAGSLFGGLVTELAVHFLRHHM